MGKPVPIPIQTSLQTGSDAELRSEVPTTSLVKFPIFNADSFSPVSVHTPTDFPSDLASPSPTTLVEPSVSYCPETKNSRPAVKRALLIGINYGEGSRQDDVLTGPHRDVMSLANVLTELYGYVKYDIVIMIDGMGYPENVEKEQRNHPTYDNILRELKKLVKDAQPGDHFLFHYSGHCGQQPTKRVGITTSDSKYILDKELRTILVDSLPAGSSLIALFDTCHSERILALEHCECNRVYTPWINARLDDLRPGTESSESRSGLMRTSRVNETFAPTPSSSVQSYQRSPLNDLDAQRYELPVRCRGNCRERPDCPVSSTDNSDLPYVVSVAACKAWQMCWETPTGDAMTQALIKILRKDPHLPLMDLLTRLSHELHQTRLDLHNYIRKDKQDSEARGEAAPDIKEHFQDPQIASHKPLDMTAPFTLASPQFLQSDAKL